MSLEDLGQVVAGLEAAVISTAAPFASSEDPAPPRPGSEDSRVQYIRDENLVAAEVRTRQLQNEYYEGWASQEAQERRKTFVGGVVAFLGLAWLGFGCFVCSDRAPQLLNATVAMVGALSAMTVGFGIGVMRYILVNPWVTQRPLVSIEKKE